MLRMLQFLERSSDRKAPVLRRLCSAKQTNTERNEDKERGAKSSNWAVICVLRDPIQASTLIENSIPRPSPIFPGNSDTPAVYGNAKKPCKKNNRPDFADQAWENSQEHLRSIVVELARCVLPFSEHAYLPLQHAAALLLVGRLSERAKGARADEEGVPAGLYSSLKYSTKKNGVARAAADVRATQQAYSSRKPSHQIVVGAHLSGCLISTAVRG